MPRPGSYRILVAGFPRSGTQFTHQVLRRLGLDVGHETDRADGCVGYGHLFRSCPYDLVLHQVRDPLRAISSAQTLPVETWLDVERWVPLDLSVPRTTLLLHAWVAYNRAYEAHAAWRYRVEDLAGPAWPAFAELVGRPAAAFPDVPLDYGTRSGQYRPLSWAELEDADPESARVARDMARRYGYEHERNPDQRAGGGAPREALRETRSG